MSTRGAWACLGECTCRGWDTSFGWQKQQCVRGGSAGSWLGSKTTRVGAPMDPRRDKRLPSAHSSAPSVSWSLVRRWSRLENVPLTAPPLHPWPHTGTRLPACLLAFMPTCLPAPPRSHYIGSVAPTGRRARGMTNRWQKGERTVTGQGHPTAATGTGVPAGRRRDDPCRRGGPPPPLLTRWPPY